MELFTYLFYAPGLKNLKKVSAESITDINITLYFKYTNTTIVQTYSTYWLMVLADSKCGVDLSNERFQII